MCACLYTRDDLTFSSLIFSFPFISCMVVCSGLGKGPVAIYYAPLRLRDDVKPINVKGVNGTAPPSSQAKRRDWLGLT